MCWLSSGSLRSYPSGWRIPTKAWMLCVVTDCVDELMWVVKTARRSGLVVEHLPAGSVILGSNPGSGMNVLCVFVDE